MKKFLLTRKTGSVTDIIPIAIVLSVLLTIVGQTFSSLAFWFANLQGILQSFAGDADTAEFLLMYLSPLGCWIVFLIVGAVFKKNRPMLGQLVLGKGGNTIRSALIGLLLGFLANGTCILISCLMGDIVLSYNSFQPAIFFAFFLAVTIQSGSEEIIDRCYLYQKLRRGYSQPWVAIVVNAAAFSAMHLLNPGIDVVSVVQIMLIGIIFSLFVYYFDSLWAAIMMHAGWNFTQSIVFGLPNSGIVSKYSLFKLDMASARNGLFYNVNFGVEGSVGALGVLTVVLIGTIIIGHKGGERRDLWSKMEAEVLSAEMPPEQ